MYNYLIYLRADAQKTLPELHDNLKSHFAGKKSSPHSFQLDADKIILRYKKYAFHIHENQQHYIGEELHDLLENSGKKDFAGRDVDMPGFANAVKRFELHGDDDLDMNYFNESLFIIDFFENDASYLVFETLQ